MLTDRVQALLEAKNILSDIKFQELFDAIALLQTPSDRDFLATLLNFHLAKQQKALLSGKIGGSGIRPAKGKGELPELNKVLNLIIGIDGVGKSTFYQTAHDLFEHSVYVEKRRRSLYKFCEHCFSYDLPLTIEAKLTLDDYDLLPIIDLAKKKGYRVVIYSIDVESTEKVHDRLSLRDQPSAFTGHDLSAMEFFAQELEDELLIFADRLVTLDNSRHFNLVQINDVG